MDISCREISDLGGLIRKYGKDSFVFGTHSPILDYLTGLIRIESLRESEANESVKELVKYEKCQENATIVVIYSVFTFYSERNFF